jgi:hypothetical protein
VIVKTVGRGQDNNIVVNDAKVSRVHLQMVQDDNGNISVVDLGSANGTYVNGKRIASETRLKAGDELCIGDTPLPWQNYFPAKAPQVAPAELQKQSTPSPVPTKRNLKWIYIGGGVLALMLLVGGFFILHNNQKNELKQKEDEGQMLKLENELKDAEKEAIKLEAEYAHALREASSAKSKHEKDSLNSIVAEKAQMVTEAKNMVTTLTKDKKEMEDKLNAAQTKLNQAEAQLNATKAEKEKAEKEKADAMKQIDNEKSKTKDAVLQAQLTTEFYKQLNEMRDDKGKLQEACKKLNIPHNKKDGKDKLYKGIVALFDKAKDNATRQKYVNALKGKPTKQTEKQEAPDTDNGDEKGQTPTAQ